MITYELAKQLKNAGFDQQDGLGKGEILHNPDVSSSSSNGWIAYSPTLSELIEACGDKFYGVNKAPHIIGGWLAKTYVTSSERFEESGSSPEEAVAKLWLSLNSQNGLQQDQKNQTI